MAFGGVGSTVWQQVRKAMRLRLWLLVMFPANFFSFLVDELARLTVWLTVGASDAQAACASMSIPCQSLAWMSGQQAADSLACSELKA